MTEATADVLVERYVQYRDHIKKLEDEHDKLVKPYKDAMATIENAIQAMLNETGAESIKTVYGTAYRSTVMSTKVVDRGALFDYVRSHDAFDLLTAAVAKDAVKEFMDTSGGFPPPGVDTTFVHKVNVRRS